MPGKLVFLGDSLTQGFDWLGRFPDYSVVKLGISGETVEGLLSRTYRIGSQVVNPDFVFLMTGINNIANEQYDIITPYRELILNLTTWYQQARVVVQSILPVELTWISNNIIRDTNCHIEQITREFSVAYLDIYSAFVDSKGIPKKGFISEDGVHLARKGYEAWANEVERCLVKMSS